MAQCTCADPMQVASALSGKPTSVADTIKSSSEYVDETLYGKKSEDEPSLTGESGGGEGEHGRLDRIRFCHWAAPEYGVVGETMWTNAFKAAQLGISLLNSIIQGQIEDKKQDLAERYYQQAKYKWDRFKNNYMPLEYQLLNEASTAPIREMNCEDDRARAIDSVDWAYNRLGSYDMGRKAAKYHLCLDPTVVNQLAYSQNKLLVDTENYNLRDDQWFTDFKNDQRWNRRSNILNLGRNMDSVAMQYGDLARKLLDNVGNLVNKAAGSISQALGYYGIRNDTVYPTTYLHGNTNTLVNTQTPTVSMGELQSFFYSP